MFINQLTALKKVCAWPVTNIVAMATGSFHDSKGSDRIRERSMLQLASVLTVREVLGGMSPTAFPLFKTLNSPQ